jgi:hypothetical protein
MQAKIMKNPLCSRTEGITLIYSMLFPNGSKTLQLNRPRLGKHFDHAVNFPSTVDHLIADGFRLDAASSPAHGADFSELSDHCVVSANHFLVNLLISLY